MGKDRPFECFGSEEKLDDYKNESYLFSTKLTQ